MKCYGYIMANMSLLTSENQVKMKSRVGGRGLILAFLLSCTVQAEVYNIKLHYHTTSLQCPSPAFFNMFLKNNKFIISSGCNVCIFYITLFTLPQVSLKTVSMVFLEPAESSFSSRYGACHYCLQYTYNFT